MVAIVFLMYEFASLLLKDEEGKEAKEAVVAGPKFNVSLLDQHTELKKTAQGETAIPSVK